MKAFVVEHYGEDGLHAADVPEPEVGDGDVLVKVSAASVNPLDKMVRNGEFKRLLKYRTPFVLGHDVAGVVTRVGSLVRDFEVGDEVYARPRDLRIGTFAEYIAIDQDDVAPKPDSLTLHEAAAVPLVSLAAWQALVDRAHVKPGQKVLVHAGSGGLGSTVIQLAKHLGATVATTLWPLPDDAEPARVIYHHLRFPNANSLNCAIDWSASTAGVAVHYAAHQQRANPNCTPFDWANHIHHGP